MDGLNRHTAEEFLRQTKEKIAKANAIINKEKESIELLTEAYDAIDAMLKSGILDDDDSSKPIVEVISTLSNRKQKKNDIEQIIQIIKYSPKELGTKEIVEQYAERTNSKIEEVRAFVDASLSRLTKDDFLIRSKIVGGRGSSYKLKSPE